MRWSLFVGVPGRTGGTVLMPTNSFVFVVWWHDQKCLIGICKMCVCVWGGESARQSSIFFTLLTSVKKN